MIALHSDEGVAKDDKGHSFGLMESHRLVAASSTPGPGVSKAATLIWTPVDGPPVTLQPIESQLRHGKTSIEKWSESVSREILQKSFNTIQTNITGPQQDALE